MAPELLAVGLMTSRAASFLLLFSLPLLSSRLAGNDGEPLLQRIAYTIAQQDAQRDVQVPQWSSLRTYRLTNPRWKTEGQMTARMIRRADGTKQFEILTMQADGVARRTFLRILETEVESSRPETAAQSRISPDNYTLKHLGQETVQGRRCYVVQLIPKRRHRLLLDGKAWIDEQDLAIVKIIGRTAERMGFWVGQADIDQEYKKVGGHWFSAKNRSAADVRLLGRTSLTIEYTDYTLGRQVATELARR